jgi:hypothetical protein
MIKYFYLKTLKELIEQNLNVKESPTYIDEMNALAINFKGKRVLMTKNIFYWDDPVILCKWNIKWLKEVPVQLEFNFNA